MNNALITDEQRIVLLANGRESLENPDFDPAPVVKLFTPDAGATWLLTEIDPDDHDHAFGLCDLGLGMPEIGWVSLGELATVRGGGVATDEAREIAAARVPVIAQALADLPASFEQVAATESNVGRMAAAGVTVALSTLGYNDAPGEHVVIAGDSGAGMAEAEEQGLVQEFIPHPSVERLADAVSRAACPGR